MTIIIARYLCTLVINIYSIVFTYAIYIDTVRNTDLLPFRSDELNGFTDILVVHALLFHSQYLLAILRYMH